VQFSEDPGFVLRSADEFLSSEPVLRTLILSILHARKAQGDPGRMVAGPRKQLNLSPYNLSCFLAICLARFQRQRSSREAGCGSEPGNSA